MIYVAIGLIILVCSVIFVLYLIGKRTVNTEQELIEKIKEAKINKKRVEKLKSYSRTSYAKVPSMKRKSKQ